MRYGVFFQQGLPHANGQTPGEDNGTSVNEPVDHLRANQTGLVCLHVINAVLDKMRGRAKNGRLQDARRVRDSTRRIRNDRKCRIAARVILELEARRRVEEDILVEIAVAAIGVFG